MFCIEVHAVAEPLDSALEGEEVDLLEAEAALSPVDVALLLGEPLQLS